MIYFLQYKKEPVMLLQLYWQSWSLQCMQEKCTKKHINLQNDSIQKPIKDLNW